MCARTTRTEDDESPRRRRIFSTRRDASRQRASTSPSTRRMPRRRSCCCSTVADGDPTDVIELTQRDKFIWQSSFTGCEPGQLYGYKVGGDYRPGVGAAVQRRQAAARSVREGGDRKVPQHRQPAARLRPAARRRRTGRPMPATTPRSCRRPSSSTTRSTGRGQASPDLELEELIIYEVHVKGFTAHPSSRVAHPGHVSRVHREDSVPRDGWASMPSSCCRSTRTTSTIS